MLFRSEIDVDEKAWDKIDFIDQGVTITTTEEDTSTNESTTDNSTTDNSTTDGSSSTDSGTSDDTSE